MDIFCENLSEMTRQLKISALTNEITVNRLIAECEYECSMYGDTVLTLESEVVSKITGAAKKIIDSIVRLLKDMADMILNMFSNKEGITAEDFLQSETGKITFDKDLRVVDDIITNEIREGHKIINAISRGTNIPYEDVKAFVDKSANAFVKVGPAVVGTAAGVAIYKGFAAGRKKDSAETQGINATMDGKDIDNEGRKKINMVLGAISKTISEGTKILSVATNTMNRRNKRAAKNK